MLFVADYLKSGNSFRKDWGAGRRLPTIVRRDVAVAGKGSIQRLRNAQ